MNEFEFMLVKDIVEKTTIQKKLEEIIRKMNKELAEVVKWSFNDETINIGHVYKCKIYQLALAKYNAKNRPAFFKDDFRNFHHRILNAIVRYRKLTAEEINFHIKGTAKNHITFYSTEPSEIECLIEIFREVLPVEIMTYSLSVNNTDNTLIDNANYTTLLRLQKQCPKSAFLEQELLKAKDTVTLAAYKKEIDKLQELYEYGVEYEKNIQ